MLCWLFVFCLVLFLMLSCVLAALLTSFCVFMVFFSVVAVTLLSHGI